tara:strand:- start:401 stop:553 length:153 start_codon:yes stop_codon:yes gene_type:complete
MHPFPLDGKNLSPQSLQSQHNQSENISQLNLLHQQASDQFIAMKIKNLIL